MRFFRTNINSIDRKRLSKYLGMSLSNPSLPESIRNIFWMYYLPDEKETYVNNNRKEAAFFGLTLMCALGRDDAQEGVPFESKLSVLMKNGSESDERRIKSMFMSNMTMTSEYVETIGKVIRKEDNLKLISNVDINKMISDLIDFGNVYRATNVKSKWASRIYQTEEKEVIN